jgi:pSer/pThr/pTyr-binding forkhead associated (FHA) protein
MDDPRLDAEAAGLPVQGPHWRHDPQIATGPSFLPLRLVLLPRGMAVECTQASVLIGRHSTADVRLPLPEVSRRHCRLIFADGHWQVFDLNSLNGIFLNGEKVQQAVLRHRDELRVGGFTFRVDLQPGDQTVELTEEERRASAPVLRGVGEAVQGAAHTPANPNRQAS